MSDVNPAKIPEKVAGGVKPKAGGNILTKKVGALPIWAYALILAGMLVIGFWWKSRGTTRASVATDTTTDMTGDDPGSSTVSSDPTPGIGTASTSNTQWSQNAADALMSSGSWSNTDIQNALNKYLGGSALSPTEQAIVNAALSAAGTPPGGVTSAATSNTPVSYTTVRGDSLTSIAQMFYGDSSRWKDIYQANIKVIGPDPQKWNSGAGLHLTLPGNGLLATPQGLEQSPIPATHKYTVQYGDSTRQLAQRFYGDINQYQKIYNANKGIITPGIPMVAGTIINIPD